MASFAKTTRPKITNIYLRARLFKQLDRNLDKQIVWVKGPPGSGKTTLIASYLEERRPASLWYQVDERDADIATFFHYMGQAARKANPRKRKPMPHLTPEYLPGLPIFTRNYFEELYSRMKPPFLMVLDNYQEVTTDSPFHEIIAAGINEIPEKGALIVVSRTGPPPVFSRLKANNQMAVLDWSELKLTLDEAKGVARSRRKKFTPSVLQNLHDKSGGWAAGFTLLTEQTDLSEAKRKIDMDKAPEAVFDYFAYEVLRDLDEETREVLLKSAYLPKMTPDTLEGLTGSRRAGSILAEMSSRNYFIVKRAHPHVEYQYHQMFREFLLAQARETFSASALTKIKTKAASLLEEQGQIEDAIETLISAKDWENAGRLVIGHAQPLLLAGRTSVIHDWLSRFPKDVVDNDPWLLLWMGKSLMLQDSRSSIKKLLKSYEMFKADNDLVGTISAWLAACESILMEYSDYAPMDRLVSDMNDMLSANPKIPSKKLEALITLSMYQYYLFRKPESPQINEWEKKAARWIQDSFDIFLSSLHSVIYITHQYWKGAFAEAERLLTRWDTNLAGKSVSPFIS